MYVIRIKYSVFYVAYISNYSVSTYSYVSYILYAIYNLVQAFLNHKWFTENDLCVHWSKIVGDFEVILKLAY